MARSLGKCVHFRGIQHATCKAGVEMASVRDASGVLPCLTLSTDRKATTSCPLYREPTAEEIAADQAAWTNRLSEMNARTERGECLHCGAKVTDVTQVGRCVYVEPCGHRLGQGDAKTVRKALGLDRS
ncbi:MAG: hypothetical protein PVSMB8_15270 [Vulcanimicrobiaceae bacterium]